ncbi:MAG: hypothetical protein LBU32_11890 [Clostridiales bacterium]|jgi:hypothetical protein|nr:hypothetical protein [Clostridiales bacterium]
MKIPIGRIVAAAVLSGLLAFPGAKWNAYASEGSGMRFEGFEEDPKWSFTDDVLVSQTGSAASSDDIYDYFGRITKDLEPGQARDVYIHLYNYEDRPVLFGLKAWPATGEDSRKLTEIAYPGKTAYDGLLDLVRIDVSYSGGTIYSGTMKGGGSGLYSEQGIELNPPLASNEDRVITMRLTVPVDLDNSYKNGLCAVHWQFLAGEAPTDTAPTPQPTPPPAAPSPTSAPGQAEYPPSGGGSHTPPSPINTVTPLPTLAPEETESPFKTDLPADGAKPPDADAAIEMEAQPTESPRPQPTEELPSGVLGEGGALSVTVGKPDINMPKTGRLMTFSTPLAIGLLLLIATFGLTFIRRKAKRP